MTKLKRLYNSYRYSRLLIMFLCIMSPNLALALTDTELGSQIMSDRPPTTFNATDAKTLVNMVLISKSGRKSERLLEVLTLKVDENTVKTRVVFKEPRNIQGTGLLTISIKGQENEQWLFLPSLGNPKKISSNGKSKSFVGSEFSFEDMDLNKEADTQYRYLEDITENDQTFRKVELVLADKDSAYSKQIFHVDKNTKLVMKVDYFDWQGNLFKSMFLENYEFFNEAFWRPNIMKMQNHITGKSTELTWVEQIFDVGLDEDAFTINALERAGRSR